MAGKSLIGNLAVSLTLQTAAFQKGATIAEKRVEGMKKKIGGVASSLKGFGAALAGSLAVGAVTSAITRGLEYASSLGEVAQQLGVTTKELQEYRYAASQAGIEQEQMDSSLAKLTRSIGEAQQGSKSMVDAFGRLGITLEQIRGKSTGEVFKMIADGMAAIPDPAQRAAIQMDLFGRSGQKLDTLLAGGSKGINELSDAAQKLGIVLSNEQIQKADATADKMTAFKQVMEAKIAGVVANNADAILKLADTLGKMAVGVANGIAKISQWITTANSWLVSLETWSKAVDSAVVGAFTRLWKGAVEAMQRMVEGVRQAITGQLTAILDGARKKIEQVRQSFFDLWDKVTKRSYIPDMVSDIAASMAQLGRVMVDPALTATEKVAGAFSALGSLVGSLFGDKAGSIVSSLGQLFSAIAAVSGKKTPGLATGGSFMVGGAGGRDRNMLSLNGSPVARVSRGERVHVSPNNDNSRIQIIPSPYFDVVVDGRAQRVAAPMAGQAAVAGASGAQTAIARRQFRMIP